MVQYDDVISFIIEKIKIIAIVRAKMTYIMLKFAYIVQFLFHIVQCFVYIAQCHVYIAQYFSMK